MTGRWKGKEKRKCLKKYPHPHPNASKKTKQEKKKSSWLKKRRKDLVGENKVGQE